MYDIGHLLVHLHRVWSPTCMYHAIWDRTMIQQCMVQYVIVLCQIVDNTQFQEITKHSGNQHCPNWTAVKYHDPIFNSCQLQKEKLTICVHGSQLGVYLISWSSVLKISLPQKCAIAVSWLHGMLVNLDLELERSMVLHWRTLNWQGRVATRWGFHLEKTDGHF